MEQLKIHPLTKDVLQKRRAELVPAGKGRVQLKIRDRQERVIFDGTYRTKDCEIQVLEVDALEYGFTLSEEVPHA